MKIIVKYVPLSLKMRNTMKPSSMSFDFIEAVKLNKKKNCLWTASTELFRNEIPLKTT